MRGRILVAAALFTMQDEASRAQSKKREAKREKKKTGVEKALSIVDSESNKKKRGLKQRLMLTMTGAHTRRHIERR